MWHLTDDVEVAPPAGKTTTPVSTGICNFSEEKNIEAFREKLSETAQSYILATKHWTTQTGVINPAQKWAHICNPQK